MIPPIKGNYSIASKPTQIGEFASGMVELNFLVQQLQDIKRDANIVIRNKILEIEKKVDEKIGEIEKIIKDSEKFSKILQSTKEEVLDMIASIKKGDPGKDADPVDLDKLEKKVLRKLPKVNIKSLAKSVIEILPENKSSLKIIQETLEADPLIIAFKIIELIKEGKFKFKKEHVDGLEQTISILNNQLSAKIGGGGFSNIYKDNVLITNGLSGLNFSGLDVTTTSSGGRTIVTVTNNGISGTPSFNETPSGTIDGSNSVFTLAHTPNQTSLPLFLFLNGVRQRAGGVDFTLSGATITFITPPETSSVLVADYYY